MQMIINKNEPNKKMIIGFGDKEDEILLYIQDQLSAKGMKFILILQSDAQFDDETKRNVESYKRAFPNSTSWGIINDK